MCRKIYVGNYPSTFNENDIFNIFLDFEGIELVGFFRNNNKCYSFINCVDKHQLIEIVTNMHGIDVCGRNLIVRASDEKFQMQIEESFSKISGANRHLNENKFYEYAEARPAPQASISESKNAYSQNDQKKSACHSNVPNSAKRITKQNKCTSSNYEIHDNLSHSSESDYSTQYNGYHADNSSTGSTKKGARSFCQNLTEFERKKPSKDINPQETFSKFPKSKTNSSTHYKTINERFKSYEINSKYNRENPSNDCHRYTDLREKYAHNTNARNSALETVQHDSYETDLMYHRKNPSNATTYQAGNGSVNVYSSETGHDHSSSPLDESLNFVSVVNFPLYTSAKHLNELFADFNPIKIFIMCNRPRIDRTPTEAIICFAKEKEATDAILTFDNTEYRGRILLVNDAVDKKLVTELLTFG